MPRWHLSLPLPAAPTLPSRLHHSSSPIAIDSPSRRPLMSGCSRAVHRQTLPSVTVYRHAAHHRQVAIAPSLSIHQYCDRSPAPSCLCCPSPYIAIKELSRHPLPSRSRCAIHCRRAALSITVKEPSIAVNPSTISSCRRSVHCCPLLLSCRRAIHRHRTAPSITVKLPSRRPLPSIAVAITVHQHRARAIPCRPSRPISRRAFHHRQVVIALSIAVHCCPSPL